MHEITWFETEPFMKSAAAVMSMGRWGEILVSVLEHGCRHMIPCIVNPSRQ